MPLQSIPQLVSAHRAQYLEGEEIPILDLAESIVSQGDAALQVHIDAITIAGDLAYAHENDTPEDEALHIAAQNLKLYHLDFLARHFEAAGIMPVMAL